MEDCVSALYFPHLPLLLSDHLIPNHVRFGSLFAVDPVEKNQLRTWCTDDHLVTLVSSGLALAFVHNVLTVIHKMVYELFLNQMSSPTELYK